MSRRRPPEPVGSEELKDAILAMMVRAFGDRPLDWETVGARASAGEFRDQAVAMFAPSEGVPLTR